MKNTNAINSYFKFLALLVFLLMLSPMVMAFGVTSPYWDTKPLGLHPGETKDFSLILQNMVGDKDVTLKAFVSKGTEIATLVDPSLVYHVPFGVNDVQVNVRVAVPLEASFGEIDRIGISFVQVAAEEEGKMVQISGAVATDIPVIISPFPPPEPFISTTALMIIVGVVLLGGAVIGYLLFRKREDSD